MNQSPFPWKVGYFKADMVEQLSTRMNLYREDIGSHEFGAQTKMLLLCWEWKPFELSPS